MIQHCDPFKNFFIYSATKSENKQITTQPKLVLNLKKRLLYFSKQTNNENTYLKKIYSCFIRQKLFLLKMLLFDFTVFIKQKTIKKISVLYKDTIKKAQKISNNPCFFIKNIICIFLPQGNLKQ